MYYYIFTETSGENTYIRCVHNSYSAAVTWASGENRDYSHWWSWTDGAPPSASGTPWTDSRSTAEKRRAAYKMELDYLVDAWQNQKDMDGASETTSLTGTVTMTNESTAVTGSGTSFSSELSVGDYLQLDADIDENKSAEVKSIESNTALTLEKKYKGTGGSGAASQVLTEKGQAEEKRDAIKAKYS